MLGAATPACFYFLEDKQTCFLFPNVLLKCKQTQTNRWTVDAVSCRGGILSQDSDRAWRRAGCFLRDWLWGPHGTATGPGPEQVKRKDRWPRTAVFSASQVRKQAGQRGQGELGHKQDNERLAAPPGPAPGLLGNGARGPAAKDGGSGLATLASVLPITVPLPTGRR